MILIQGGGGGGGGGRGGGRRVPITHVSYSPNSFKGVLQGLLVGVYTVLTTAHLT